MSSEQYYFFTRLNKENLTIDEPYRLERGKTLLNNFKLAGVRNNGVCGGKGICGCCKIRVVSGNKFCNQPVQEEKNLLSKQQRENGWRLACQLYSLGNISVFIPDIKEENNDS